MRKSPIAAVLATAALVVCTIPAGQSASAAVNPGHELSSRALQPARPTSKFLPGTKCRVFPANNAWHALVSELPVNPLSDQWMANSQAAGRKLHPDFGPSFGEIPVPYGIPFTITNRAPRARVSFDYSDESDHRKYPLTAQTKIEGGANADGDRHAIVVNKRTCTLYETYDTHHLGGNRWSAGSGATWSLKRNNLRPAGWTSADAAGLPILPGLLRWDEVKAGKVDHAIRFTLPKTRDSYLWPARHKAGSTGSAAFAPMGARFRLKAGFDLTNYSPSARVIITAMRNYGLILADNGSPWYFQGTSERGWPASLIEELKRIPASSFEAVDAEPLKVSANSALARR